MTTYHLEARAIRNTPRDAVYVLYGLDWEVCEGTHGLMHVECEELAKAWARDDRLAMRDHGAHRCRAPHEYRIVADLAPDPEVRKKRVFVKREDTPAAPMVDAD